MQQDKTIKGVIYKYTSPINKIYIGQTTDESGRRQKFLNINNKIYAGPKINKAREKYGPKSFKYEVIFTVQSIIKDEVLNILNQKEREYIKLFDSFSNGYNMTEGGDSTYIRTEENLKNISKGLKEYYKTHKSPVAKTVLQYSLNGEFIKEWPSGRKAAIALGLLPNVLTESCNPSSLYKTCGNYIWRYKQGEEIPLKIIPPKKKVESTIIIEYTIEGNKNRVWKSMTEAANDLGYSLGTFSLYCNGKNDHYYKGYLYYRYEPETPPTYTPKRKELSSYNKKKAKVVLQYDLKGVLINKYRSINDASKLTGISSSTLKRRCKGIKNHIYNNYKFYYE